MKNVQSHDTDETQIPQFNSLDTDHQLHRYNNNNVHLSCAHQHPECSHDTY